jgi:excisionase family DNA binding protein
MASNGISIGEACRRLGVSEKELRAMMADGRLPYRRVNATSRTAGHVVIRPTDVDTLLKPSKATATLRSPRMRELQKALERAQFVQAWTDQPLLATSPEIRNDSVGEAVAFDRSCRFAERKGPH